ncbi:MAG: hydrolase 2, exosortase A system-associated [Burkholderiaceae bacterium]|nr:hydrolase 2, exosortase A system-associated [Burkholderiaceae bacterium]
MRALVDAFFATVRTGQLAQRLCIWHAPEDAAAPTTLIVHIHGFAEEMNKSRRMAAQQSRAFAAVGHAVLQMDLLGCGDSAGEFSDATWQCWVDDAVAAVSIARDRYAQTWPDAPPPALWLWGHRLGCLLATAAAPRIGGHFNLLFWQPTPNGKTVLQQFLRLETASKLMGKRIPVDRPSAKERLAADLSVDVAGYGLSAKLARGIEAARLTPPAGATARRIEWLDVAPQPQDGASPATQQALAAWSAAGWVVRSHAIVGPAFWQTTEIEDAPALISATIASLGEVRSSMTRSCPDHAAAEGEA